MAEAAEVPTDRRHTTMKKIGLFAAGVLFDTAESPEKAAETPAE